MDGNQKPPASGSGQPATSSANPAVNQSVYNPPSLTEPSVSTTPTPVPAPAPQPAPAAQPAVAPVAAPAPAVSASAQQAPAAPAEPAVTPAPEAPEAPADQSGGFYHAGTGDEPQADAAPERPAKSVDPVEWTSNSDHFRMQAGNWRLKMGLMAIVGGALVFLITRSYFSAGAIIFAGIAFGVLGARPPRPINYRLDDRGIAVGGKYFSYAEFRAFSVSDVTPTINLVPLKRFAPIMVLRYDVTVVDRIVSALSSHLPMETPRRDAVDSLVSKLKI